MARSPDLTLSVRLKLKWVQVSSSRRFHFGTGSIEAETSTERSISQSLGSIGRSLYNPHVH